MAVNNTVAKGGQDGAITYKGKTVIELFEWYCLRHPVQDFERPNPVKTEYKLMPIKMKQSITEQDTKEGRKIEYFKVCPKCSQTLKEGEYIKNELK